MRRPGQESPPSRQYLVQGLGLLLHRLQQEGPEGGRTERHLQERQRISLGREEEQREASRVLHQLREKGLNPWRAAPACHRAETARKVSSEGHSAPWCSGSPSPSSSTLPGATSSATASSPYSSPSSAPR